MRNLIRKIAFIVTVVVLLVPGLSWPQVDPHCSDGDCEPFALHCLDMGRVPMCVNFGNDTPTTICVGVAASSQIFANHPDACRGTCSDPVFCNDGATTLITANLNGEPLGMCPEQSPTLVDIAALMQDNDPRTAGFAHALLPQDVNGDGYACALFRCNTCPPKAQHCTEICGYVGPLSDNDQ